MILAHVSDLHVFAAAPEVEHVRRDIARVVKRIVVDLATLEPDAVLITGDVADGGTPEDYALLCDLLGPLTMPVLAIPGNHDRREPMRAGLGHLTPFAPGPFLNFEAALGPLCILGLDSVIPGRVEGSLCTERLRWIETRLGQDDRLTFLLVHHPPFPTGVAAWDATALVAGRRELGSIIAAAPGEVRLLCGHVHRPIHSRWAGAYCAIAGSPAFQFGLGIGGADEPGFVSEPYRYFLHHVDGDGSVRVFDRHVPLD